MAPRGGGGGGGSTDQVVSRVRLPVSGGSAKPQGGDQGGTKTRF